ncbi:MAG TPA: serine/threonine-protein kinase [Polyangiaceae bacterium]|jgi:serine/threonine-protein kinase
MGFVDSQGSSTSLGAPSPVAVGEEIAAKYRVERILGRGAMGLVVAARHLQLDQVVAIKLLHTEAAADEIAVERFEREARAAARLRSDHVARVLDVGRMARGTPYMVMEYLEGADLAEVLETRGAMSAPMACGYVVEACDAVAEAHARGIVHRDLKPENLYLTTRVGGGSMVKVLDFGISKLMTEKQSRLTQTRAVVGSPLYMAPEQLRSSKLASPRSDVWSLGVVLYELLTRRWPFEADSLPDLCLKVAREEPQPLDSVRADLPPGLGAIVLRCLEKDPEARYADAGELARALEPFLEPASKDVAIGIRTVSRSLVATRSAVTTQSRRADRPSRRWVPFAVAGAATIGALAVLLGRSASSPQPLSVAAVEGALTSSTLASLAPPSAVLAPAAPAPSAPSTSSVPGPVTTRNHALVPLRGPSSVTHPAPKSVPAPAFTQPVDDIPAFR